MDTAEAMSVNRAGTKKRSDTPADETTVWTCENFSKELGEEIIHYDNAVNEKMDHECTLKQHKRLSWFWNMLSALHECGHACLRLPCMAEKGNVTNLANDKAKLLRMKNSVETMNKM